MSPPRRSRRPRPSPLDELEPSKPDGIWEQDGLTTRRWIARSLLLLAKRDASVGDVRYLDMGDLFYLSHDDYSHLSSFPPRGFGDSIRLPSQLRSCSLSDVLTRFNHDGDEFRVGTRYDRCGRREDKVERSENDFPRFRPVGTSRRIEQTPRLTISQMATCPFHKVGIVTLGSAFNLIDS